MFLKFRHVVVVQAKDFLFFSFRLLYQKLSKDRHHLPAQTQSVNDAGPGGWWWTREAAAAGFAARADVLNESHDHVTVWSGGFLLITTLLFFFPYFFLLYPSLFGRLEFFY